MSIATRQTDLTDDLYALDENDYFGEDFKTGSMKVLLLVDEDGNYHTLWGSGDSAHSPYAKGKTVRKGEWVSLIDQADDDMPVHHFKVLCPLDHQTWKDCPYQGEAICWVMK